MTGAGHSLIGRTMRYLSIILVLMYANVGMGRSVAFLGDSISTGGGAHPYLALDLERFRNIVLGKVAIAPDEAYLEKMKKWGYAHTGSEKPIRLPLSRREFHPSSNWLAKNLWHSFGVHYLDAEEYSWAYLLNQGGDRSEILIVAQDGAHFKPDEASGSSVGLHQRPAPRRNLYFLYWK